MTERPEPRVWNLWLTLAAIGAAVTMLAGILEILGIWHDLGLGVGLVGMGATLLFGFTGATSVTVRQVDRRLDAMHDTLRHQLLVLNRLVALAERRTE
jgi:hypothetical protein